MAKPERTPENPAKVATVKTDAELEQDALRKMRARRNAKRILASEARKDGTHYADLMQGAIDKSFSRAVSKRVSGHVEAQMALTAQSEGVALDAVPEASPVDAAPEATDNN